MKPLQRLRFLPTFGLLLLLGLGSLSVVSYLRARELLNRQISGTLLPITSDTIYTRLERDLLRPVLASGLMAGNTFLTRWVLSGEGDPARVQAYLASVQQRTGATTAFLVSERTRRYYHPRGVIKQVSAADPQDRWFFRFRDSGLAHEINIDRDTADLGRTTAFINVRLQDSTGAFLGAVGLGIDVRTLAAQIQQVQHRYGARVFFLNDRGKVMLAAAGQRGTEPAQAEGLGDSLQRVLADPTTSFRLTHHGREIFVNSRHVPSLGWVLVVLQERSAEQRDLLALLAQNLLAALLISALLLLLAQRILGTSLRELELAANTDKLTGLLNRNAFEPLYRHLAASSHRHGQPLVVATFDIDHFKQVNDRYGHPEGDRVLRHLAHRLSHGIRRTDLLFRWGGEEFLLLLPDCTLPQALLRLEAIRTDLRHHPAELTGPSGPTALSITLSCGVTVHRSGEPSSVLLRRVDSALYAAKREGRDRVICLGPEESGALQRTTSTGQDA
ncbi:MAG: sensor domain-containing diguanylate cyclase [Synechococcus sp.]|nr:sensor domain-containing diguanylate cyclase [Synechococcus sp.]